MSDMAIDILRRSISADTAEAYIQLLYMTNSHDKSNLLVESMSDRALRGSGGNSKYIGNPHDDPLYRLLVKEAQDEVAEEQRAYKERIRLLKSMRSRVEKFMLLIQTSGELQKRIEAARDKFVIQNDVLVQLREHIARIQDKRILVSDKLKQL